MPQSNFVTPDLLVVLDKAYQSMNEDTKLKSCLNFDPNSRVCQACKFYVEHPVCNIWLSVFGVELQKQLIAFVSSGVKVNAKFMDIWNARKIQVESAVPKKAMIAHSAEIRNLGTVQQKVVNKVLTIPVISMTGRK